MAIFLLVLLTLLPGTWIVFGLPLQAINGRTRVALAVALSPAVLAIQFVLVKLLGLEFATAAPLLALINLPSLLLLWRARPTVRRPRWSASLLTGLLLYTLFALYTLSPKLVVPNYRAFSWHALFHVDIIYQLTQRPLLPEEPELAGVVMSYGWLDHVYWSVLGWLSDWSPTSMYALTSLIWLLAAVVLAYELAKTVFGLHAATAWFSVGLLFLGTNVMGATVWLLTADLRRWLFVLGDGRYTPFLGKYVGFETMPFAFALLLGLTLVCTLSMQRQIKHLGTLVASLLIALGLLYPLLFPVGALLVAGLIGLLAARWVPGLPPYTRRERLWLAAAFGLSLIVFLGYLGLVTQDRVKSTFQFTTHEWQLLAKGLQVLSALLPFILLAGPLLVTAIRRRSGPALLLAATALALMGAYVLADLSNLEYKFIFGATMMLFPLSAATLDPLFVRLPRWRWPMATAVPLLLVVIHLLLMYRLGARLPSNLANAPRLQENAFWLALDQNEPEAAWLQAVRDGTPANTILVAHNSRIHLGPFVARSLYLPSDADGVTTAGYSVPNDYNMLTWRGYSAELYGQRRATVAALYEEQLPANLATALQQLQKLNRPLAIHFSGANTPALTWLREQTNGCALFADEQATVWFIPATAAGCTQVTASP